MSGEIPVVIPAYKPGTVFVALVSDLLRRNIESVIVVDDGSGPEYDACFATIAGFQRVFVIHHAVNFGKGAALKTGLNFALASTVRRMPRSRDRRCRRAASSGRRRSCFGCTPGESRHSRH